MRYPSIRAAVAAAVVVVVLALSSPAFSQTVSGLLQKGIYTEETVGDLDAAIKIYEQVVAEAQANRTHVAQAHFRLAMCYEKKGRKPEAVTALQKLIEQFPNESQVVAQARAKLSALGQAATGVTVRQVWADAVDFLFRIAPSPDGKYLSYVDWPSGDVAVRELATGKNRRLSNQGRPELGGSPVFSPDGKQVAYSWLNKDKSYELRLIGLDGTGLRIVYANKEKEVGYLEANDWSVDGKYILVTFVKKGAVEIVLVSTVDGSVRVLSTPGGSLPEKIRFSPDGRYVAYDYPPQKYARQRDLFLLHTDGSAKIPVVEHSGNDILAGWSPDGKRLVFGSDRTGSMSLWLVSVVEGKPQGAPELVKAEMGQFHALGLTRSGSFYYGVSSGNTNVYTATLDLEQGKVLTPPAVAIQRGEGSNFAPAWSPDGKYLACLSQRMGRGDLFYIRSSDTKEVRELVPNAGPDHFNADHLVWSPDGRELLGGMPMRRVNVQTGAVNPMERTKAGLYAALAPDGKALFYLLSHYPSRLARRDLETGVEQELYQTSDHAQWWTLSPDGQQLAFAVGGALKVLSATGGNPQELVKGEGTISTVAWTPDGRQLLFGRSGDKGATEVWRVPVTGGEPQKLELAMPALQHLRIHPDGHQVAFTASSQPKKCEVWVLENFLPPPKAAP